MTWFQIQAQDVWLFRDGKPFTAGEDNSARSIFPPTPYTVQGALRNKISEAHGLSFDDYRNPTDDAARHVGELIGTFKAQKQGLDTGAFTMRGPFLGLSAGAETTPLFPCPADLLHHDPESGPSGGFRITAPEETATHTDLGLIRLPQVFQGYENLPGYWMTGEALEAYQQSNTEYLTEQQEKQIFKSQALYKMENRFGVSTESTTSFRVEGMLYQVQFVRPAKDVVLLVEASGKHEDKHVAGQMTLGGEQRLAFNSETHPTSFPTPPNEVSGRFKVIFLTPAYFRKGWFPEDWSSIFGAEVECVSAALYRPLRIGGWNSAAGKKARGAARAMVHYVAPGSVYYFEAAQTFEPPKSITENPRGINDAKQIGFGQVAYSTW